MPSSTGQDIRPSVMWKIVDYSTGGSLRRWIGYLGQKIWGKSRKQTMMDHLRYCVVCRHKKTRVPRGLKNECGTALLLHLVASFINGTVHIVLPLSNGTANMGRTANTRLLSCQRRSWCPLLPSLIPKAPAFKSFFLLCCALIQRKSELFVLSSFHGILFFFYADIACHGVASYLRKQTGNGQGSRNHRSKEKRWHFWMIK